jgi:rRNA maturation endonuclease Nob1
MKVMLMGQEIPQSEVTLKIMKNPMTLIIPERVEDRCRYCTKLFDGEETLCSRCGAPR